MTRFLTIVFGAFLTPALLFAGPGKPDVTVITQNQYLGADLTPIISAETPEEYAVAVLDALAIIAQNNIPERAEALARSIVKRDAHLVGLQEVFKFNCVPNEGYFWPYPGTPCDLYSAAMNDHLQLTLNALEDLGAHYVDVAVVENLNLPNSDFDLLGLPGLPVYLDLSGVPAAFIQVLDRDVILARDDIVDSVSPVPFPCLLGKVSEDGCNYAAIASASILGGLATVDVERGFVGVDAMVDGKSYRFVNTHLEVRYPAPILDSRFIQSAQAEQLLGTLMAVPLPSEAELLLVGDINSDSEDEPVETIYGTAFPPYMQLATFYTDVWNLRPGYPKSLTCCQLDDLSNHKSDLYERIDVIFSLNPPSRVKAKVLGDRIGDKTASGLWPSDHASVVATLSYD